MGLLVSSRGRLTQRQRTPELERGERALVDVWLQRPTDCRSDRRGQLLGRLLRHSLQDFLGSKGRFDPHGDPIPHRDGTIDEIDRLRLSALQPGERATIAQCTNEHPRLLDYLKGLGLVPGATVVVRAAAPFNGPLTLVVDDKECAIGLEAAETLIVQR